MNEVQQLVADIASIRSESIERVRTQASLAEIGFRSIILANGGGIVGLLTLIGNGGHAQPDLIMGGFASLLLGMFLALASLVLGFLSQKNFYEQAMAEQRRSGLALAALI